MKVLKFGGSSVGTPERIKVVKQIVEDQKEPCIVVVSAFQSVTDQLIKVSNLAEKRDDSYKQILEEILKADERILKDPAPVILVSELGESSVDLAVRPWVKSEDFLMARSNLLETIKSEFDAAGITIPFPQRHVHMQQVAA